MSEPVRLLAPGTVSWLRTQALYHALAELMTEDTPDTLILVRPEEPYVCIGYHQSLGAVLDRVACKTVGLPIVRRRVGGGTTYLDKNQPFYQYVFHHKRLPFRVDAVYARLLGAPVAVLRKLGLNADIRDGTALFLKGEYHTYCEEGAEDVRKPGCSYYRWLQRHWQGSCAHPGRCWI
ncbi:MAG: lipoate--protein ligase family protein [Ktedonobacteraceae bacterium]